MARFDWPEWERLREDYAFLQDQNAVSIYDPSSLVRQNGDILCASYGFSREERPFLRYFDGVNDSYIMLWILPRQRIPVSQSSRLTMGEEALALTTYDTTALKIQSWGPKPEKVQEGLVALHVDEALPLLLDQALLICEREHLVPFTDDPRADAYLVNRYESLLALRNDTKRPLMIERSLKDNYKFERLALNAVARILPDEELKSRSFEDLCRYRSACGDSLSRFRSRIWQLVTDLEDNVLDPGFEQKIKRTLEKEIVPEVGRLEDS